MKKKSQYTPRHGHSTRYLANILHLYQGHERPLRSCHESEEPGEADNLMQCETLYQKGPEDEKEDISQETDQR